MRKKGFAIILVLATLVLLAMLSLTYIKLALIDRNIARNYMDNKRAKLIAQSGVDYAAARMQEISPFDSSWQYDRQNPQASPSFKAGEVIINGQTRGYSQVVGSTYSPNGDLFVLKIDDSQSKINMNDGLGNPRVRANLSRIINNLAKIINPAFPDIGTDIIGDETNDKRPTGGYSNVNEIKSVLTTIYGSVGEDYYDRLKPFVTTHAWQDPNVANPVPLSNNVISAYPVWYNTELQTSLGTQNVYRYGRGYSKSGALITAPLVFAPDFANGDSLAHGIYGLDELNPQWIEVVSRSPVNINTASKEVLIALLKDLGGFFISDRRRDCPIYNRMYDMARLASTSEDIPKYSFDYSPASPKKGDEAGFLYATEQIDTSLAASIADEIINCRDKTGAYAIVWFGGQFKTWRQFNAFCDDHVGAGKLLNDTRTIFYEYDLDPGSAPGGSAKEIVNDVPPATFDQLVNSEVARRQASQAMADVLKANFNPNLHLNETNPDANIKLLVDKTDLIVNSTEFCFSPMGYFEIESEGMILKNDRVIAQSKTDALVKLYDAARYTNEKQFLEGILVEDKTGTNNAKALEIGPEPCHIMPIIGWKKVKGKDVPVYGDPFASDNEWGGYIALSTVNGPDPISQATFYSHFSKGFKADYHADGDTYQPNRTDNNVADSTESGIRGPYVYGLNNRLARSFRKESEINTLRAPCDLRIDGAYVERHAGLAYDFNGTSTLVFKNLGMLSYWIKPSFYPETTGKPRTFFSLTKPEFKDEILFLLDEAFIYWRDKSIIFANFFLPAHWPDSQLDNENDPLVYKGRSYRSTSLVFGYTNAGGIGHVTPSLNHLSHSDGKTNYLISGQWIHVACIWQISTKYCKIWINGGELTDSTLFSAHMAVPLLSKYLTTSRFRVGEPTYQLSDDWIRNWTSDSTVDEFYIFTDTDVNNLTNTIKAIYNRSRYYKLDSSPSNETSYISSEVLGLAKQMNNPSWSTIASPSASGSTSDASVPKTKIIGVSWTYYGEDVDAQGNPLIRNYKKFSENPSVVTDIGLKIKVSILKNYDTASKTSEAEYGSVDQDGYSSIAAELTPAANYRYKVTFKIEYDPANPDKDPSNTVLLYSPVFDDITIYYSQGPVFLSYNSNNE